jgi:hypothetical protein
VRTATGIAVANADIDVINSCTGVNLFLATDHSAADGTFQVTVTAAGTYDVHVVPPAGSTFAAADRQDVVITNASVSLGTVTLATARLVSGTVKTPALAGAVNADLKFVNTATGDRVFLTKTLRMRARQWACAFRRHLGAGLRPAAAAVRRHGTTGARGGGGGHRRAARHAQDRIHRDRPGRGPEQRRDPQCGPGPDRRLHRQHGGERARQLGFAGELLRGRPSRHVLGAPEAAGVQAGRGAPDPGRGGGRGRGAGHSHDA